MGKPHVPFDKRLKRIVRRHDRMASGGAVTTVTSDGLIVSRPRVYRPRFPLVGLLAVIGLGFMFKGLVFATLGPEAYAERVEALGQGSPADQAGAWVMQADAATLIIAEGFGAILIQ